MSNYLVDGADLTSVANAIRAKSGGSSQLAFPAGFVSEIQAIPSGGGGDDVNMWGNTNLQNLSGAPNPIKIICHYTSNFSCTAAYKGSGSVDFILDFSAESGTHFKFDIAAFSVGNGTGCVKEIVSTDGTATINLTSLGQVFRGQSHLTNISCPVSTSDMTSADRTFSNCTALQYINFVEEEVHGPLHMSPCLALTDDGLVFIANGLATGEGKTVTLHATPKARCSTLMGTVTQKTKEDQSTYDFFTKDESGTVTLADFITNTKGWTLA